MSSTPATALTRMRPDMTAECTLIVPVYRNAENIPALLERFAHLHGQVSGGINVVCVVDGSPDQSDAPSCRYSPP